MLACKAGPRLTHTFTAVTPLHTLLQIRIDDDGSDSMRLAYPRLWRRIPGFVRGRGMRRHSFDRLECGLIGGDLGRLEAGGVPRVMLEDWRQDDVPSTNYNPLSRGQRRMATRYSPYQALYALDVMTVKSEIHFARERNDRKSDAEINISRPH